jgi:membrane-associated protease RseP (regulator of RpoE activity)
MTVAHVQPDSPAANAGLREGDTLLELGGQPVKSVAVFRDLLLGRVPGETLPFRVSRNGEDMTLQATLGAGSRPMKLGDKRGVLGVQTTEAPDGVGAAIKSMQLRCKASRTRKLDRFFDASHY